MLIKLTDPYTRGDEVRHVQERLVAHGYAVATDGIYGPRTNDAVKALQASCRLKTDGIVGPETLAALDAEPVIYVPSHMAKGLVAWMYSILGECYLWGGFGQSLTGDNIEMLAKRMDTSDRQAMRTVALYRRKVRYGQTDIHGYDCSGAVSRYLYDAGIVDAKRNCNHLWDMCEEISFSHLIPGDLLFRRNIARGMYHVGCYVGRGLEIEAKGRSDGVVLRGIKQSDVCWHKAGRLRCLYENV